MRRPKRWAVVIVAVGVLAMAARALFVPLESQGFGPCGDDGAISWVGEETRVGDFGTHDLRIHLACEREVDLRLRVAAFAVVVVPLAAVAILRWVWPKDGTRPPLAQSKALRAGFTLLVVGIAYLSYASLVGGLQTNDVPIELERVGKGNRVAGALAPGQWLMIVGLLVIAAVLVADRARRRRAG
jgi:hypothetical protein